MDQLEHSPLGGSATHRFLNCSGSFLMQREEIENGTYENIESEYAKLGTAAHLLGSTCLTTGKEPYEYLGEEFDGYKAGWPEEIDLDAVSSYVVHCREIMDKNPGGEAMIEKTIHMPRFHSLLKGTVDFGYWVLHKKIWLRDYKNGEGIGVYVHENEQLLYYAFLLVIQPEFDSWSPQTPISLGIVQPNFFGIFEEPEVWEVTMERVLAWGYNTLLPRMKALTDAKGYTPEDFQPGDWCQFCPVLLDCPKMQDAFETYAAGEEDFIMMLSNAELDAYYAKRDAAMRFKNALDGVIHARLTTGKAEEFKNAKLVEKRTNRVWKPGSEPALAAAFSEHAYNPRKIKSPAQIEKLSSRGKEMALEYGYKPDANGLSVAPMSDPRPAAVRKGNAHVFAAFEQSTEETGW